MLVALNAEEIFSGQPNLQIQVIHQSGKIILVIKGSCPSLPKEGVQIISLRKFSGCKLDQSVLIDTRRVEVKNSIINSRLIFPKDTLTQGIYFVQVQNSTEIDRSGERFNPAIFIIDTLPKVEKYYNQNSKDIFNLLIGIKKLSEFLVKRNKAEKESLQEIKSQLREVKQLENKLNKAILESVHIDSFSLLSAMLTEYSSLIDVILEEVPLDEEIPRPGEEKWWELPRNEVNVEKATRFFTQELLLRLTLEIKIVLSELKDMLKEPEQESEIEKLRDDIDFIKEVLKEYPLIYKDVITEDNVRPLRDIMELIDNLITICEEDLKEHNRIIQDSEKEDILKKIETLLNEINLLK